MVTAPGASTRVAADWFSASNFTVDLTFNDGLAHNVAFYCLDWDSLSRTQRIDVLDTRSLSAFSGGVWLVWRLKVHLKLNFFTHDQRGSFRKRQPMRAKFKQRLNKRGNLPFPDE